MPRHRILVTGGAGYIGSVLCPKLLAAGHAVTVLDGLFFGKEPLAPLFGEPGFQLVQADIRDASALRSAFTAERFDRVIHLAAVSNDPCSELDPAITRSINLDGTRQVMRLARQADVGRFLYASSASVYGLRNDPAVTEDLDLQPLTLYARCKGEGENILSGLIDGSFEGVSIRSATVCGMSPRLRLDLTVNILTYQALCKRRITVFGGDQMRPNVHIDDLTDFYVRLLDAPAVSGEAFNVSHSNETVHEIAEIVRHEIDPEIPIEITPTEDKRSYHLDASKALQRLGFKPSRSIADAVRDLRAAFAAGHVPRSESPRYRNLAWMSKDLQTWRRFT